jgi:surface antigen
MLNRAPRIPLVGALFAAGALTVGASLATAQPACDTPGNACPGGASTAVGIVDVSAGYTLTVRRAPRASSGKVRTLADGQHVRIVCQTNGEQTTGTFGTSRLWDQLKNGGYVSDTYVLTGSDGRVAPECAPEVKPAPKPAPRPPAQPAGRPLDVTLTDDYPFKARDPRSADPWAFYYRECTSFVAFRLNLLKGFKFSNRMAGGHFGDGGHWDDNARALGYRVDNTPTVGSVMVRDSGTWGHVAIVAKVNSKSFLVEEYNHDVRHGYGTRTISRSARGRDWDHFIHFRT